MVLLVHRVRLNFKLVCMCMPTNSNTKTIHVNIYFLEINSIKHNILYYINK